MHWIDPDVLPETRGVIDTLVYNHRGELDGFVLDGERLVHVPPHLGACLARQAKVGSAVSLRAVKPRDADLLAAVAVTLGGRVYSDDGPAGHPPPEAPATRPVDYVGSVRLTLFAPRGEVCGALMDDGTIVRLHPKGNAELAEYFEPGRRIEAWGPAFRKKGTRVIDLEHVAWIAESDDQAQSFADAHAHK
jgi:hypothetical protein